MTKQEEIKGKIATLLLPVATREVNGFEATDQILLYLHSQGCVLKVEGKLPKDKDFTRTGGCFSDSEKETHAFDTGYFASQQDMLNNNWRCVESILGMEIANE